MAQRTQVVAELKRALRGRGITYAHVAKHNVASLRVLQKCGFTIVEEEPPRSGGLGDDGEELVMRLA